MITGVAVATGYWHRWQDSNLHRAVLETGRQPLQHTDVSFGAAPVTVRHQIGLWNQIARLETGRKYG